MVLRPFALLVLFCLWPLLAVGAPIAPSSAPKSELDELFDRLKHPRDQSDADEIESRIVEIWGESPSDTANLLYSRGLEAIDDDKELALELFSCVTELQPDFAEAWQELGAVNYALDAHDAAIFDLERALQLEPRHYGALLGLASIFEIYNSKKAALEALRKAYAINPSIPNLENRIRGLARDVEGQRI
jgi:tetratricopeptide (TPR) repeat protein